MTEDVQKRLNELERKWLNRTISAEEAEEYFRWLNNQEDIPIEIPKGFAQNDDLLKSRIFNNIIAKAEIKDLQSPVRNMIPVKWIAAASVIIILGISGYLWLLPGYHFEDLTISSTDGQAGGDKATLRLSDGTVILLDTATNGLLALQGGPVIKKHDGELIYDGKRQNAESQLFNSMSTPRGGQYKLVLSDGTKVWLNSASELKYPSFFSGKDRSVELSGEAYFEVAKHASKPFYVHTADMQVKVLGTHFNVNAYSNESVTNTTLLEGSVKVEVMHNGKIVSELLKPGQQAALIHENNNLQINKVIDVGQVVAWQSGTFEFRNADLGFISRQLSRWYTVDVEVDMDKSQRKLKLGGSISKQLSLAEVLKMLQTSGVGHTWGNGKVKLYSH